MNKLPENFQLLRYGLSVRLVNEEDAEFILSLRNNPKLSKFINPTSGDVNQQREWIRLYKDREAKGLDYYFIYYLDEMPIGLNRIYDIDEDNNCATGGSWICTPGLPDHIPVLTLIIMREILFDELNLSIDKFDVRKKNSQVLRIHKLFGALVVSEDEIDYFLTLTKDDFNSKKKFILDLLNIKK